MKEHAPKSTPAKAEKDRATPESEVPEPAEVYPWGYGAAVAADIRRRVEPVVGQDLSAARVHQGPGARAAAAALEARAFTYGRDIFLGASASATDSVLLAHELAHVAQQSGARTVQRSPLASSGGADAAEREADAVADEVARRATPPAVVADRAPGPGQLSRSAFLNELEQQVRAAADQELGPIGSALGCPYIDRAFAMYRTRTAQSCERTARRYARSEAETAQALVRDVVTRARIGIQTWLRTGELPAELEDRGAGLVAVAQRARAIARKPLDGGRPLPSTPAATLARSFEASLTDVRVHTDAAAARLTQKERARAVTVGSDVFFASGAFRPGTLSGDALIAHELAHAVQQKRGGPAPAAGAAHERDADQAAAAALAHQRGLGGPATPGARVKPLSLQRCAESQEPELLTPREYIERHDARIFSALRTELGGLPLGTGSPHAQWATTSEPFVHSVVDGLEEVADAPRVLRDVLAPTVPEHIVNRARVRATIMLAPLGQPELAEVVTTEEGPEEWFEDVGIRLSDEVLRRLTESLQRIVPRYMATAELDRLPVAVPDASRVIVSHPMDHYVLTALEEDVLAFDWSGFARASPGVPANMGPLRPVEYEYVDDSTWVRVMRPSDPTREEVAAAVLGNSDQAFRVSGTPPYFDVHVDAEGMTPGAGSAASIFSTETPAAGAGPSPAELVMLSQVSGSTSVQAPEVVLQRVRENVLALERLQEQAQRIGQGRALNAVIERAEQRRESLAGRPIDQLQRWDAHAQAQNLVLLRIGGGFEMLLSQLAANANLSEDPGAFGLPPYMRRVFYQTATAFTDAAAVSDLPALAQEKLADAERALREYPLAILDGSLQHILQTAHAAAQGQDDYDFDAFQRRERALRRELTELRARALSDPSNLETEVASLRERILNLQTETDLHAQLDALDEAFSALEDEEGFWASVTLVGDDLDALKTEAQRWLSEWHEVRALWNRGEHAAARTRFQELASNPRFQSFLRRVRSTLQDAQKRKLIGKLIAIIAITLVTMGVGSVVSGFVGGSTVAGGLGWGTGATLLATAGAEAVTFTVLSQLIIEDDPTLSGAMGELVFNFGLFAALRGVATGVRALGIAGRMEGLSALGRRAPQIVEAGAEMGAQGVTLAIIALARQQLESRLGEEGRAPTREEVEHLLAESAAMFIVIYVAGRCARPLLVQLEASGSLLGSRVAAANATRRSLLAQAQALEGTGDVTAARELLSRDRAAIEAERDLMQTIARQGAADPAILRRAGVTQEQLQTTLDALSHNARVLGRAELALETQPTGPGMYSAPRDVAPRLLAQHRDNGAEVESLGVDPETGLGVFRVRYPDGFQIDIVERYSAQDIAFFEARARIPALEQALGSGVSRPATAESQQILTDAKAAASDPSNATQVLDALRARLPTDAQAGLDTFRGGRMTDAQVLRAVESINRGQDLVRNLAERSLTPDARDAARTALAEARTELRLAHLLRSGVSENRLVEAQLRVEAAEIMRGLGAEPTQAEVRAAVESADVIELVGVLGEGMARSELGRGLREGQRLEGNLEVVEEVPGFATINEWRLAQPDPSAARTANLRQGDGVVYRSVAEVDVMVVEAQAGGRPRPSLIEEVKSGSGDSPTAAQEQVQNLVQQLARIEAGDATVHIFDKVGKTGLGTERTASFDLTDISSVQTQTRGLPGKGFDQAFDLPGAGTPADMRGALEQTAQRLLLDRILRLLSPAPDAPPPPTPNRRSGGPTTVGGVPEDRDE